MAHIRYTFANSETLQDSCGLFYISSASYGPDWMSMFHSHSFTELLYVTGGEGLFCTEAVELPIKKDTLVLINPNIRHTEKSTKEHSLTYMVLGIGNMKFDFSGPNDGRSQVFDLQQKKAEVLPLLQLMRAEVRKKGKASEVICQHYLSVLLLKLPEIAKASVTEYIAKNISGECELIKNYIDSNYFETITLEKLSSLSHLNKFYLSHLFADAYGTSPIDYLLKQRILHSEELLRGSDYSVTQIAHMIGFSSANYFSQAFRKHTGLSPITYRRTHKS